MQISESSLLLSSYGSSFLSERRNGEFKLTAVTMPSGPANSSGNTASINLDTIAISSAAQKAYFSSQEAVISGLSVVLSEEGDSSRLQMIETEEAQARTSSGSSSSISSIIMPAAGPALPPGWNIEFSSTTVHYETEQMRVSAKGTVTTQDGREITFTLDLGLSREYASIEQERIMPGVVMTDPLVINFRGGLPGLSDTKFAFDINSDGSNELVYATAAGSGFLAFDRNGDNIINSGSELFGPATGSGFSELSGYDSDRNGWIDENDGIFAKLSIWTKDEAGNDKLISLTEAGVGALSLNSVASAFSLTDDTNQMKGQVQYTGIYLSELGKVGAMQQIDLAAEVMTEKPPDEEEAHLKRQADELYRAKAFTVLTNIAQLAATAAFLADKCSEISRSFKEDIARACKGNGGVKHAEQRELNFIEQIIKYLEKSIKAHSLQSKEHKRP